MYLDRDEDHQDCPQEGCRECSRSWLKAKRKWLFVPLRDIDWKHPKGWVVLKLTRGMGCVRLTAFAQKHLGQETAVLNLQVLEQLITLSERSHKPSNH